MLQTNRAFASPSPTTAAPEPPPVSDLVRIATAFLMRQYPVVLFVVCLAMALAAVYLFTTPPSFTGQAKLIIDTRKVQLFQQQPILGDIAIDSATVDSQVEILKSENVARAVIKELRLTEDPEFVGAGGGLIGTTLGFIARLLPDEPASEFSLTRKAMTAFRDRLTVKRVGLTYVIDIGFRSFDPGHAARVANAIADAYVVDQLESKYQATRRASVWLQDRINELRQQASAAERAVVEFKTKNNIVDAGGGRLMTEQQLSELNSQLVIARSQTAEAKARFDRIEDVRRAEVPDATVTDMLRNDVITKLRSQYLDLSNREADWSRRYGAQHLAAVNLRNQMREIRRSIADELGRIAQSYRSEYEIAKAREDAIREGLAASVAVSQTTSQAQLALRDLEAAAQTYRTLHDNFLQRYMESVQQQSFPITEARLITEATRPMRKSHPSTLMVLAIFGIGGTIAGVGLALFRDMSDRVFRTRSQVESELQCDCISVVPSLKRESAKRSGADALLQASPSSPTTNEPAGPRTIIRRRDMLWTAVDAPFSRFAESIRSIKVSIDLNRTSKANKVIAITSSLPGEGKSTVALSLAQLICQSGARAVLLDCDLRNPSLSRELAPDAASGFLEVISQRQPLKDVLWTDPTTGLAFLPVVIPRIAHTSEILSSELTKQCLDDLRHQFDYVIVDLPPLAPLVDVRAAAHLFDSFIFVVEWGRTKIDVVSEALRASRTIYENLLGVVLNKADLNAMSRYQGDYKEYYASRYWGQYGTTT
jgi:succinoglycan biosynthesis transport protein ExoP